MSFYINYDLPNSKRMDPWSTHCFKPSVYTKECFTKECATKECAPTDLKDLSKECSKERDAYTVNEISATEFYKLRVERTAEACSLEASASQRSSAWHEARKYCITASSFGSAVGRNPYCSPYTLLVEKLWSTFQGSESTAYGTFHELDAQKSLLKALDETTWLTDIYAGFTKYTLLEVGLLKHHEQPWMAASPDGILVLDGPQGPRVVLVEFKCPAGSRDSDLHPYKKYKNCIPEYYLDQLQGIMGLLSKFPSLLDIGACKCTEALFVVWQPSQIHVTRVPYNHEYYLSLEEDLRIWHRKFVQYATLKENGLLFKNSLDTIVRI